MPRLRYCGPEDGTWPEPGVMPFPQAEPAPDAVPEADGDDAPSDALEALESVSRRMEDLARALGCLGYFDDDDRPRAA
ncbi:MAG: hypothetical protein ACYSU7_10215 [Planctomycetota bacterium]|jgi:hypothetical protein